MPDKYRRRGHLLHLKFLHTITLPLLLVACNGSGNGDGNGGATTGGTKLAANLPAPTLTYARNRILRFSWNQVSGADSYRLMENPDGSSGYNTIATLPATASGYDLETSLPDHLHASYLLEACAGSDCTGSSETFVDPAGLAGAIGYLKADTPVPGENLGNAVAVSADGNTLATGAYFHDHSGSAPLSGAVRIFVRGGTGVWTEKALLEPPTPVGGGVYGTSVALSSDGSVLAVGAPGQNTSQGMVFLYRHSHGGWSLEAQIQAANADNQDNFGTSVALSADGILLAVGAPKEDGSQSGVNATPDNSANDSGAVYLFRHATTWSQEAYIKSNNPANYYYFGGSVALSADGNTLAVGERGESSVAGNSGAVHLYGYDTATSAWTWRTRLKAANAGTNDEFGNAVSLSADGKTLAVGAWFEGSDSIGVNNGYNNGAPDSGAVYLFDLGTSGWSQTAFIKASNTGSFDYFGNAVALAPDGHTLIVGAYSEDSSATGFNGDGSDDSLSNAGAAYQFLRDATGWHQIAYLKPPVASSMEYFGVSVAAATGITAVGSTGENSGKPDDPADTTATSSGAVFLY